MQIARLFDKVQANAADDTDLRPFLGTWINANPHTEGIACIELAKLDDGLKLRVFAVGAAGSIDWGWQPDVTIFMASPSSRLGAGFTSTFDFGFAEAELQANINKGLIVLAQFHRFKDSSNRVDYFTREYFALTHDRF